MSNSSDVSDITHLLAEGLQREAEAMIDHVGAMTHQKNGMATKKGRVYKGLSSFRCRARKRKGKGKRCDQYTRQTFPFCPVHTKHHGCGLYRDKDGKLRTVTGVERNEIVALLHSTEGDTPQPQLSDKHAAYWRGKHTIKELVDDDTNVNISLRHPNASTVARYATNVDDPSECNSAIVQHIVQVKSKRGTTTQVEHRDVAVLYAERKLAPHEEIKVCFHQ